MSTSFEIRAARLGDIDAIAGLLTQLNHDEGYKITSDEDALTTALFDPMRDVQLRALVAANNAAVVGVLLYYVGYDVLSAAEGYHLADMVVSPIHRRQGIGKALATALAKQAIAEKREWISLTALQTNRDAKSFYEALGMTQVAVDFYAMGPVALHLLAM